MVISTLQALRFIAALFVMLFHLGMSKSGYKGVDLFFVMSGFVIYYHYHAHTSDDNYVKKYCINRLTKIYLLYWTSLVILHLLVPFPLNVTTLRSLLLIPHHHDYLGVSWSLSYELYFYLLMGLILFCTPPQMHKPILYIIFLVTTAIILLDQTSFSIKGSVSSFLLGHNLWEFLLGVIAACLFDSGFPGGGKHPKLYFIVSLSALVVFSLVDMGYFTPGNYIVYGVLAFLIIITAVTAEKQLPALPARKLINQLGNSSFAIYLFSPVITFLIKPADLPAKILTIMVTIAASLLIYRLYEDKALKVVRGFLAHFSC